MPFHDEPVRPADRDRAIETVQAHPDRGPLARFAFDVISRQAEANTLFSGKAFAQARATAHEVASDSASTEMGNVLKIVEEGPSSPKDRALLAAFAVCGFALKLEEGGDGEENEAMHRFVRHADWLELATQYSLYDFVDPFLDPPTRAHLFRELARTIIDDASGERAEAPAVRARNAARLSVLGRSSDGAAREALGSVSSMTGVDPVVASLAGEFLEGERGPVHLSDRLVRGFVARAPRRGLIQVLRWVSGWALLVWVARGFMFLLGHQRRAEVSINRDRLDLVIKESLLGREVREATETWHLSGLVAAGRQVRYPYLHLIVGVLCLSAGVLLGAFVLFDGIWSGQLLLLVIAAGLAGVGAALDFGLDLLPWGMRGRVTVELAHAKERLQIRRVPLEQADRFIDVLRRAAPHSFASAQARRIGKS